MCDGLQDGSEVRTKKKNSGVCNPPTNVFRIIVRLMVLLLITGYYMFLRTVIILKRHK